MDVPTGQETSVLACEIHELARALEEKRSALEELRRTVEDDEARLAALRARLPPPAPSAPPNRNPDGAVPIPHTAPALPPEALARYGRQLVLREVGLAGQLALARASVVVVGAGGLGVPAAAYLAGAGVGRVTVADGDAVEAGNLARQVVYGGCVGRGKAECLVEFMSKSVPSSPLHYHNISQPDHAGKIEADERTD
jgi:adenylyltransferase/sulfurtransferase